MTDPAALLAPRTGRSRHRAEPPSDRRPSAATLLEVAGKALDIGPARGEQAHVVLVTPGDELAETQCVRVARQALVAGQVRPQRVPLGSGEHGVDDSDLGGWCLGHVVPPGQAETRRPEPPSRGCVC